MNVLIAVSQKFGCQVCQLRSLSFFQVDVGINIIVVHTINEIGKAVTLGIEVGGINLKNITRKNNLCILPGSGNNCFNLVRCKVLSLIDNKDNIVQAPAANVCQGYDRQLFGLNQFIYFFGLFAGFAELIFDDAQIIP